MKEPRAHNDADNAAITSSGAHPFPRHSFTILPSGLISAVARPCEIVLALLVAAKCSILEMQARLPDPESSPQFVRNLDVNQGRVPSPPIKFHRDAQSSRRFPHPGAPRDGTNSGGRCEQDRPRGLVAGAFEFALDHNSAPRLLGRMKTSNFKLLDVGPMLARGDDPTSIIRTTVDTLQPGEGLSVRAPVLPSPLIEMLRNEGFRSRVHREPGEGWITYFWRDA